MIGIGGGSKGDNESDEGRIIENDLYEEGEKGKVLILSLDWRSLWAREKVNLGSIQATAQSRIG